MQKRPIGKGETVPVQITVYKDRTFDFVVKTPPVTELIKKKINIRVLLRPHEMKVGKISWNDIEDIAKIKIPDLNAFDIEQAKKIVPVVLEVWALMLLINEVIGNSTMSKHGKKYVKARQQVPRGQIYSC